MWRRLLLASLLAVVPVGSAALAGEGRPGGQLIQCVPDRSDVANVMVEDVRFGMTPTYLWARGTVRLRLRDQSELTYALEGRAVPLDRMLARNEADASFGYRGFKCVVQYPFITSVGNCHGRSSARRQGCDVGLEVWGTPYSYSVSVTVARMQGSTAEVIDDP